MNIQQLHKYTSFISFGGSINVGSERHQSYPSSALVSLLPDVSVSATSWRLVTSPGSPITRDAGKHQKEPTSRKAREGMKKNKSCSSIRKCASFEFETVGTITFSVWERMVHCLTLHGYMLYRRAAVSPSGPLGSYRRRLRGRG